MTISLTVNGTAFEYPEVGDSNWGNQATLWAQAVTTGMLQKAGGSFTLTADVDFGATYGLKSAYFKSRGTPLATTGVLRLANTDVISWRDSLNSSNRSLYLSGDYLFFGNQKVILDPVTNDDISSSAGILFSKMAALTASRAVVSNGSGVVSAATTTSTQIGYLSTTTGDVQVALDAKLPLAGGTMTGDLFLNADPSASNQAATKNYVDNAAAGNVNNFTVRVASTAAVNLSNELENGDTLDGVTLATNDLVLVKNQASTSANGIYVVPASGAASRYTGMDTWTEVIGASVFVTAGTANAGTNWKFNTAAGGTLGVTAIPIVQNGASQVYSADGQGIELSGTTFGLELDGATLSKSGSGLKVNEIANAQIAAAAAIAVNKLAAVTVSRALVSDGSGFVSAATTTATELGYVNGVTSAIQTQLDSKTLKSTLTTRGDMYYASSANTPARLAVGTSGYVLESDGTDPVWTSKKTSYTMFESTASSMSVSTSWTTFTLSAAALTAGTAWSRSTNDLTPAFTGVHNITVELSSIFSSSTERNVIVRLQNITDGTTADSTVSFVASIDHGIGCMATLQLNVSDVSKVYQVQIAASGMGVVLNRNTISSTNSRLWRITIFRPYQ